MNVVQNASAWQVRNAEAVLVECPKKFEVKAPNEACIFAMLNIIS